MLGGPAWGEEAMPHASLDPRERTVQSGIVALCTSVVLAVVGSCTSAGTTTAPGGSTGPTVASIALSPSDTDIGPGESLGLAAALKDASGHAVSGQGVSWATSDPTVATVSAAGVVAGVAPGIVKISVTASGKAGHAIVAVIPPEATADASAPALAVDANADRHSISRLIYGTGEYSLPAAAGPYLRDLGVTVTRWGGDGITRYNWQADASNAGGDWYFMAGGGSGGPTPGGQVDAVFDRNKAGGVATFVSIPIIDYINKVPHGQWSCSFPRSSFPTQDAWNPYVHPTINGQVTDCGNGLQGGTAISLTPAQVLAIHVPNSVQVQQGWIQHFVAKYGTASNGGVPIFALDNEPSGWGNTHRDVAPGQITYQNLVQRTTQYDSMIKATDKSAKTAGPEDFGWAVYVGNPANNGGLYNAQYYLRQLRQHDAATGTRSLDYFTEHFYASPPGVVTFDGSAGPAAVQAARLRSTRSLWDSTYREENWIGQYYPPIQLIRTFHKWIDQYYPGTRIGITEYNWGGQNSMNGALAQADVLGIFGREGLDLATLWGPPPPSWPAASAFRIYRNYDGMGSTYGDTWVRSTSGDQSQLAIYGAIRSQDGTLTIIAINKTATPISAAVNLANFVPGGPVMVYQLTPSSPSAIVHGPSRWMHMHGFAQAFPANSVTLLVIPPRES